jgi:hypothetical protein
MATLAMADTVRWIGFSLCLLWMAQQLSRLITWLRRWGQRDPLSQAFRQELQRRGLALH